MLWEIYEMRFRTVSTYMVFKYDVDPKLICVNPDTILVIRLCVMSIIEMGCNFYNSSVQYKLIMWLVVISSWGVSDFLLFLAVVNEWDSLLILINHNCRMINTTNSMMNVLQKTYVVLSGHYDIDRFSYLEDT